MKDANTVTEEEVKPEPQADDDDKSGDACPEKAVEPVATA